MVITISSPKLVAVHLQQRARQKVPPSSSEPPTPSLGIQIPSFFLSILIGIPKCLPYFTPKSLEMLFNPAKSLLSRVAGHTLRKSITRVPRATAFPVSLKIKQQQRGMASAGTKDYTVRDALNEALGMFLLPTLADNCS